MRGCGRTNVGYRLGKSSGRCGFLSGQWQIVVEGESARAVEVRRWLTAAGLRGHACLRRGVSYCVLRASDGISELKQRWILQHGCVLPAARWKLLVLTRAAKPPAIFRCADRALPDLSRLEKNWESADL